MKVSYKNSVDDITEMNLYYRRSIPKLRQIDLLTSIILFILFLAIALYLIIVEKILVAGIIMAIIGMLFLKFGDLLSRFTVRFAISKSFKSGKNERIKEEKTLIVDEKGIEIIRTGFKTFLNWDEIFKAIKVEGYIFIYSENESLVIPLSSFKSATEEVQLINYLDENVKDNNFKFHK